MCKVLNYWDSKKRYLIENIDFYVKTRYNNSLVKCHLHIKFYFKVLGLQSYCLMPSSLQSLTVYMKRSSTYDSYITIERV